VNDLDQAAVLDALDAAYQNLTAVASGLGEADLMRPSRCAGWAVADVLYHQLLDARRALRTFASPSDAPVDCDDVSYWTGYAPGAEDSGPAHAAESAAHGCRGWRRGRVVIMRQPSHGCVPGWTACRSSSRPRTSSWPSAGTTRTRRSTCSGALPSG
jgi:mycothiol maleylpyruvate isomerase-like protein